MSSLCSPHVPQKAAPPAPLDAAAAPSSTDRTHPAAPLGFQSGDKSGSAPTAPGRACCVPARRRARAYVRRRRTPRGCGTSSPCSAESGAPGRTPARAPRSGATGERTATGTADTRTAPPRLCHGAPPRSTPSAGDDHPPKPKVLCPPSLAAFDGAEPRRLQTHQTQPPTSANQKLWTTPVTNGYYNA